MILPLVRVMQQDNPLGLWPLQETSGTNIRDWSPNGKHGTYSGSMVLGVKSGLMSGVNFTGGTGTIPDTAQVFSPGALGAWTIEAWFRTTDNGYKSIFAKYNVLANNTKWSIRLRDTNRIVGYADASSGAGAMPTSPAAYNDGVWHHAMVAVSGARVGRLIMDGVEVNSATYSGSSYYLTQGTQVVSIASYDGTIEFFLGQVAYCAIYNTELSTARALARVQEARRAGVVVG